MPTAPYIPLEVAEEISAVLIPVGALIGAVVAAFVVASALTALVRLLARRWPLATELSRRAKRPMRAVLIFVALWIALVLSTEESSWTPGVEQALTIAIIASLAWLLVQMARLVESAVNERYPLAEQDNRHARRVRTQTQVMRQLVEALIVTIAVSAALLTFPGMRAFGASILASAGLLSIVAGIAAQNSLANLFAGTQIAFSDAIRVDDVVVIEGEWGRIEEITMTYVVVHLWDDRRLILPSTYFTTNVFQNWTRRAAELLGTVELDVDWTVPMDGMRAEMHRLLAATDLWDGRVAVLQVTNATGGLIQVRVLVSAANAPTLFDLRCYVREGMVTWLRQQSQAGLPRTRLETVPPWGPGYVPLAPPVTPEAEATSAAPEPVGGEALPIAAEEVTHVTAVKGGERAAPETAGPAAGARAAAPPVDRADTFGSDARLFTGTLEAIGRSLPFARSPRDPRRTGRAEGTDLLPESTTEVPAGEEGPTVVER